MQRVVFIGVGIATITLGAAGLTEATLAWGGRDALRDGKVAGVVHGSPNPHPSVSPSVTPTPTLVATPAPTPLATSVPRTATTNSFVHMRASASINSAVIANLNGGTVVTLGAYVDTQWQEVSVAGQTGYIYRSYLAY